MVVRTIEKGSAAGAQTAGVCVLFIPYLVIFTPRFRLWVIDLLRASYFHDSPRSEWNHAVDPYQPRRLRGYLASMVILGTPPVLLFNDRTHNKFWWHFCLVFVYLSIPILIAQFRPHSRSPMDIYDMGIIFFLLLPSVMSTYTSSAFPDVSFQMPGTWPDISLLRMSAFNAAIIIFYVLRPLNDIGLGFDWAHWEHKQWVLLRLLCAMVVYSLLAIPLGLMFGFFDRFNFDERVWIDGFLKFWAIYFILAIPLELMFRGIIQNLVHSRWDSEAEQLEFESLRKTSVESDEELKEEAKDDSCEESDVSVHARSDLLERGIAAAAGLFSSVLGSDNDTGYDSATSNYSEYDSLLYASGPFDPFARDTWNTAELPVVWTLDDGFWKWFNFQHKRDWHALVVSSTFFAFILVNYEHHSGLNIFGAFLVVFWLAICVGWLWRHMHACVLSALLSAFVMFIASTILSDKNRMCANACG